MDSKDIKRIIAIDEYTRLALRRSNLLIEAGTAHTEEQAKELVYKADELKQEMSELHDEIIYKNENKECDCRKCELQDTCNYKEKYQRFPRTVQGALGLCKKL